MELTHLRYFAMVARELHFRKAAAKLNITQAPLSAAVKKLEEELGCQLFNRTSRVVELTGAGRFFLEEAEAVLNRADLAEKRLQDFLQKNSSRLSIGYNEPAIHSFLPGILAKIRSSEPSMQLELRELETSEQFERLKKGTLDIGFLRPAGMDLSGLTTRLILREKYVLAMRQDQDLAEKDEINPGDLAGKDIILFARDVNPAVYDQLVLALSSEDGLAPNFHQEARNKSSMLAMVQAGFGTALMPESCCFGAMDEIVFRELKADLPPVDIMAAWNENNLSAALRKFLDYLPHTVSF